MALCVRQLRASRRLIVGEQLYKSLRMQVRLTPRIALMERFDENASGRALRLGQLP